MVEAAQRGDHSSRPRIAPGLKQPTRGSERPLLRADRIRAGPALPSYLALLHAGFSVPRMLPSGRWALTPPFHPCQMRSTERGMLPVFPRACRSGASITGGLFSVALSVAVEDPEKLPVAASKDSAMAPWRYQARCPAVAGSCELTTTGVRTFLPLRQVGAGDHPAHPPSLIIARSRSLWNYLTAYCNDTIPLL